MSEQNSKKNESELLINFAEKMQTQLDKSNEDDNLSSWNPSIRGFETKIAYHMAKLTEAMIEVDKENNPQSRRSVNEYSVNMANFLAKAASIYGIDATQSATIEITKKTVLDRKGRAAYYSFVVVDAVVSSSRAVNSLYAYNNTIERINFDERRRKGFFVAPDSVFEHKTAYSIPLLPCGSLFV